MSNSLLFCSSCREELPAGSSGLCPRCLLKAALEPLEMLTDAVTCEIDTPSGVEPRPPHCAEDTTIGRYTLLQELGEGGFGIVYLAQQREPVKRRVALKVIKPGMDSREVVGRFEAERQALALMDHPNIAQVFDGGVTELGRPYFVMEFVNGMPITRFCDDQHLSTGKRLELFLDVLAAVQHAHQKGIIHRDLKPSNILVSSHDGGPMVKVIDFGVAKALNRELTEKTVFTAHGAMVGTFEYMSPEQAELNALDVDTRSDLYSLGVVLYELLTGRTPLDSRQLRGAGYAEIQRMIREEEPPRPSTRLSTMGEALTLVAEQRNVDPAKLARQIRGELDWIVMKALEKDRGRRYANAGDFAADLRRHLADEPVTAGPPSRWYRVSKLVRKHRASLGAAAAVMLALVAGVVVSVWQAREARLARDAAKQEAAISKVVNDFMLNDLFGAASPLYEADRDLKVRTVLDRAVANVGQRFEDQPLVEGAIRFTLGSSYRHLGDTQQARSHLERCLQIRAKELGAEHPETLAARAELAEVLAEEGRYAEAEAEHRAIIEMRSHVFGKGHPDTLMSRDSLAAVLWHQHKYTEAEVECRGTLKTANEALGLGSDAALETGNTLGLVLMKSGKLGEAERVLRETVELDLKRFGADHPTTLAARHNFAVVLDDLRNYAEAEPQQREVHAACERVLGNEHPSTLTALGHLARLHTIMGRDAEAEAEYRKEMEIEKRLLGAEHPNTLSTRNNWADVLRELGRLEEAVRESREVLKLTIKLIGPESNDTQACRMVLAAILQDANRDAEAETERREVLRLRERDFGSEHPGTLWTLFSVGCSLKKQGRFEAAGEVLKRALEGQKRVLGPTHPDTIETAELYQQTLTELKRTQTKEIGL